MATWMLEVYYSLPVDPVRECGIEAVVAEEGGRLDFHEIDESVGKYVCLTFEFKSLEAAERTAERLRSAGEHVEGPGEYGE